MASYYQSLSIGSITENAQHIATVTGTYATTDSSSVPDGNVNLSIQDVTSGAIVDATGVTSTQLSNGNFTFSYDASQYTIAAGDKIQVVTNDTSTGATLASGQFESTNAIDGYLAGATVFIDSNNNGKLDSGEYSTTTNSQGNAFLPVSTGQIIAVGGTDTTTGLSFSGTLSATAGASVITSLTTLVNQVAQSNGGNVAAAQTAVANALGLSSSLNLNTLDPIAATSAGTAGASTALAASAQLINTATLVSATGASGNVFTSLARQIIQGGGTIDLTNASVISSLASSAGASSVAAAAVGQIAAASNSAVAQAAVTNASNPTAIVSAVGAISLTAQGTTATALTAAGSDTTQLAQTVAANTGTALQTQISQSTNQITAGSGTSSGSEVVTGASTDNSTGSTTEAQIIQNFLAGTPAGSGTLAVSFAGGGASNQTNVASTTLGTSIGIVNPGSNIALNLVTDTALLVTGGSKVDLSGSSLLDVAGGRLRANVTLGDGANLVILNNGPSSAHSSFGNDTIISSGGHDTLSGGSGQDSMLGGGQSKLIGGQAGYDTLHGGLSSTSHDTIQTGVGSDLIVTNAGANRIFSNENDTVLAGNAHDTITAGAGSDTIHGGFRSVVYSNGASVMRDGNQNIYNVKGADTIYGSNHSNTINVKNGADGVVIDGTHGTGHLDVNIQATNHGNDTIFGGTPADGSGSNLTIHVTQSFTEANHLDKNGLEVIHLAGGQTLHVSNVIIDFHGTKTSV